MYFNGVNDEDENRIVFDQSTANANYRVNKFKSVVVEFVEVHLRLLNHLDHGN